MNKYDEAKAKLEKQKCKTCQGLGKCDDAGPGDIGYNEWPCPACKGTGLTDEGWGAELGRTK
jgi:DnaJ-class molecular chaperone